MIKRLERTIGCFSKAKEDEPVFVLQARDRLAPAVVRLWCTLATLSGRSDEKINSAAQVADEMEQWRDLDPACTEGVTWDTIKYPDGTAWRRPFWPDGRFIWFSPENVFVHWSKDNGAPENRNKDLDFDIFLPSEEDRATPDWVTVTDTAGQILHDYTRDYTFWPNR